MDEKLMKYAEEQLQKLRNPALSGRMHDELEVNECQLCEQPAAGLIKIKNRYNGNELDICYACYEEFGFQEN